MPASRHLRRSVAIAALSLFAPVSSAHTQEMSVQKLVERGALDQAGQRAEGERDNPESTYLAAQAFTKMDQSDRANQE